MSEVHRRNVLLPARVGVSLSEGWRLHAAAVYVHWLPGILGSTAETVYLISLCGKRGMHIRIGPSWDEIPPERRCRCCHEASLAYQAYGREPG